MNHMSQELIEYIRQAREARMNNDEIVQDLVKNGWDEEVVRQHLAAGTTTPGAPAEAPGTTTLPTARSLFGEALSYYKTHFKSVFGVLAVPAAGLVLLSLLLILLPSESPAWIAAVFIGGFALAITYFLMNLALFSIATDGTRSFGNAYKHGLSLLFAFIWIGILTGFASLGGFVLLFVPGIIIGLLVGQSVYLLFSENVRGVAALTRSWFLSRKRLGAIFVKFLFFGLIAFVITLPFSILAEPSVGLDAGIQGIAGVIEALLNHFVIIPLGVFFGFAVFHALRNTRPQAMTDEEQKGIRKKIVIFSILGIFGVVLLIGLAATIGLLLVGEARQEAASLISDPSWLKPIGPSLIFRLITGT